MKVRITYTELQTFELVKEVEMSKAEYKAYLKLSQREQEQKYDLCASTGDAQWTSTEILNIDTDIIN